MKLDCLSEEEFIQKYVQPKDSGYMFCRKVLAPVANFIFKIDFAGLENVPKEGGFLLACNHIHAFDAFVVSLCTNQPIRYLAKKELFENPFSSWFVHLAQCIPVDRSRSNPFVTNASINILENGGCIGIFPEGTRNRTSQPLLDFKFGCVKMSQTAQVPIVPMAIKGNFKLFTKIKVQIGEPFTVDQTADLTEANDDLKNRILVLMEKNND